MPLQHTTIRAAYYNSHMRWLSITIVLLLTGTLCRRAAADELRLSVVVNTGNQFWILRDGDTTRDGDRMALRVESAQAVYINVVYVDRDGPHLIHPNDKPDRLLAAVPRRVPISTRDWLVVEGAQPDHTEREDLLVIASPTPLTEAAALARSRAALAKDAVPRRIETERSHLSLPQKAGELPPPGLLTDPGYRALLLSHDSHVPLNRGAGVLRFSFWHR